MLISPNAFCARNRAEVVLVSGVDVQKHLYQPDYFFYINNKIKKQS